MEVYVKYVVYYSKGIMGSDVKGLVEVDFRGFQSNSFRTEEDAIACIIENGLTYTELIILKQIIVREE
jgi:hypothetical protein